MAGNHSSVGKASCGENQSGRRALRRRILRSGSREPPLALHACSNAQHFCQLFALNQGCSVGNAVTVASQSFMAVRASIAGVAWAVWRNLSFHVALARIRIRRSSVRLGLDGPPWPRRRCRAGVWAATCAGRCPRYDKEGSSRSAGGETAHCTDSLLTSISLCAMWR